MTRPVSGKHDTDNASESQPERDPDTVSVKREPELFTTQQTADYLNVSKAHVVALQRNEVLTSRVVGRHLRTAAKEVTKYSHARNAERSSALDELGAIDSEFI